MADKPKVLRFVGPKGVYEIPADRQDMIQAAQAGGLRQLPETKEAVDSGKSVGGQLLDIPKGVGKTILGGLLPHLDEPDNPWAYAGPLGKAIEPTAKAEMQRYRELKEEYQKNPPKTMGERVSSSLSAMDKVSDVPGIFAPPHGIADILQGGSLPASRMVEGITRNPGELVDKSNIQKNFAENKWGEGTGRVLGQAGLWASIFGKGFSAAGRLSEMAKAADMSKAEALMKIVKEGGTAGLKEAGTARAGEEMGNIGSRASKLASPGMDAAKVKSAAHEASLAKEEETISKTLSKQMVNVQNLRQNIVKAVKTIEKLERAPDARTGDIAAVKDIVSRLSDRIAAGNGMMAWPEARTMFKELDAALAKLRGSPSQALSSAREIKEALGAELQSSAKAGAAGDSYQTLLGNWRKLNNWRRGYAKVVTQGTPSQMEAKISGKGTAGIGQKVAGTAEAGIGASIAPTHPILGSGMIGAGMQRMFGGGTKAIAAASQAMLNKANLALEGLGKEFGVPPTPAPPPTAGAIATGAGATSGGLRSNQAEAANPTPQPKDLQDYTAADIR